MDLAKIRQQLLKETKKKIADSITEDNMISQVTNSIQELTRSSNMVGKRLREWFGMFSPEMEKTISGNLNLASDISSMKLEDIKTNMGGRLKPADFESVKRQAELLLYMEESMVEHEKYLEKVMKKYCPNLCIIAGASLGGQLLAHAGTLKGLATMTASTVQLIGAEKALFRHLKTGARTPKHGIILQHQFVQTAKSKGKAARVLADKITLAARVDFFKGKPIAGKLLKELESKNL